MLLLMEVTQQLSQILPYPLCLISSVMLLFVEVRQQYSKILLYPLSIIASVMLLYVEVRQQYSKILLYPLYIIISVMLLFLEIEQHNQTYCVLKISFVTNFNSNFLNFFWHLSSNGIALWGYVQKPGDEKLWFIPKDVEHSLFQIFCQRFY